MFPDKLRVSSFPDRLLHYAWTAAWSNYSDFVGSRACTCLGVTCHLHFWQNGRSLFTCHCGNTGVERTPKKESAEKVNPREEKFPAAPAGIRTRNLFDHESGALTNKLSWLTGILRTYLRAYLPIDFFNLPTRIPACILT